MKKEEIICVRILTVIGASALMALILIFGAGSGTVSAHCKRYQRQYTAIKQCRCRNLQPLFFIKDWMCLYRILYAVTVFGTDSGQPPPCFLS